MGPTICYWRGSAEAREDLFSALTSVGLHVVQARGLEEVLDHLSRSRVELLVVDASASQREASDRIVEVANTEILHEYPTVFVSVQAAKRITAAKGRHELLYPIDIPYRLSGVLRGIQLLIDAPEPVAVDDFLALIQATEPAVEAEAASPPAEGETPDQADSSSAESSLSDALEIVIEEAERQAIAEMEAAQRIAEPAPAIPADVPENVPEPTQKLEVSESVLSRSPSIAAAVSPPPQSIESPESASRIRQTVEDTSAQNRERLRASRDPEALSGSCGGEHFSLGSRLEDFDDSYVVPDGPKRAQYQTTLDAITEKDAWVGLHARRSAFVATAIGQRLSFSKKQKDNLRLVCLFINWAAVESTSPERKKDYLQQGRQHELSELAQTFRESAAKIEQELGETRAAQTVELVAKLLVGDRALAEGQKELLLEAECVLIVELSDRACWSQGHWNPSGAYRTIRCLRLDSGVFVTNRPLRAAVIRVVGEGVTRHITVGNVFISIDDVESQSRSPVVRADRRAAQQSPEELSKLKAVSIRLSDLAPGMRIAQPLLARDGKLILEAQTVLSEELLFQLYQLAAVRALDGEVAVTRQ
ncbi:MAG: hypothetical protein U0136_15395 [Bdellovibrionota bacterium]